MSYSTFAQYKDRLRNPRETIQLGRGQVTGLAGRAFSHWAVNGDNGTGVVPTTAVVPTNATVGSVGFHDLGGPVQRILSFSWATGSPGSSPGGLITISDRLSHQGGLSGTATGAQTTNLPTAALTRYTSGVDVHAALEIYTAVGATPTTAVVSYTDDDGNAGQTSPATTFGGSGFSSLFELIRVPLASGDRGVRAVASVTLAASTGTAGNFGVTLYKPLLTLPMSLLPNGAVGVDEDALLGFGSLFPQVLDGACLWFQTISSFNGGASSPHGQISFAQDPA